MIVREAVAEAHAPRVVSHNWAPDGLRPRLDELRKGDPERYRQLTEHFDSPVPALVAAAISDPPAWLRNDDLETWELLAQVAKAIGEWGGRPTRGSALERRVRELLRRAITLGLLTRSVL